MERWQPVWMESSKMYFDGSLDMLAVFDSKSCVLRRVWAWNMPGNVLERVARITKDVEPSVVAARVICATLLYYLGEWLWDWTGRFVEMLLCMQDYVKSLVAPVTKHFNSRLIKHQFPSQRSTFDSWSGKHPWILFWYSVTVLVIGYRRMYRSCISVKILAFAYVEPNLVRGWRIDVCRRVCPGWILRQKRKSFTA